MFCGTALTAINCFGNYSAKCPVGLNWTRSFEVLCTPHAAKIPNYSTTSNRSSELSAKASLLVEYPRGVLWDCMGHVHSRCCVRHTPLKFLTKVPHPIRVLSSVPRHLCELNTHEACFNFCQNVQGTKNHASAHDIPLPSKKQTTRQD